MTLTTTFITDDDGNEYEVFIEDDESIEDDEPSDQDMMSAFGTKWHDGL